MEIHQNLTTNITAANKSLEVLKEHFSHCFDNQGNFQMEKFQAELEAGELNFSKESYGLDWLGRSYSRLLASDATTTLLKEDEAFNHKSENANSQNLLLKGDNLEILKHLSNSYFEKVKMIYIDPPYNTGGDGFVYQDDRKFTVQELQRLAGVSEEKAKRILEFTMSKSNSHSAWLTFMYPRLYVAKQLLRDDGVIFVSIDDNEVAQLRLLMDEIFGEENFVAEFIWERAYAPKNDARYISSSHDYVLLFAKQIESFDVGRLPRSKEANDRYKNPDNDLRGVWKPSDMSVKTYTPNNDYKITTPSGRVVEPPTGRCWSISEKAFSEKISENRIWYGSDGSNVPCIKRFLSELKYDGMVPNSLLFHKLVGHSQEGSKEVVALFDGKASFDGPKPVKLIQRLLRVGNTPDNSIILDFFAGSGTTGDAVMQLNAEDGGNRKFILVQIGEKIEAKKSKTSYEFVKNELGIEEPNIFEITKERLIRAANKLREERPVEVAEKDLGFKVFETIPLWEDYHHKAETLEDDTPAPFRGDLLGVDDLQALFITWKTYDGSPLTETAVDVDLGGYVGKYVNDRLYLMDKGFTTDHLVKMLQNVLTDPDFNPRSVIVFESNFQSKCLRELYESLKNFQNHKSLEIAFIMRF